MYDCESVGAVSDVAVAVLRDAKSKDVPSIQSISICHADNSFPTAWTEEDFRNGIKDEDDNIVVVAILNNFVAGVVYADITTNVIKINRISVDPYLLKVGIGTQIIHDLKQRLSMRGFKKITADVPECNLRAQQFFKSCGFKVRKKIIKQVPENLYPFEFTFADLFSGRN